MASRHQESSLAETAVSAVDLGVKVAEIAVASGVVIGARMMLIGAALRNPLSGDYRELRRMVPEKIFALAQSGIAYLDQIGVVQRDVNAQLTDSRTLMSGGLQSPATIFKLASAAGHRGTRAVMWPYTTGVSALAPVHRTVTSNAKRLKRPHRLAR